VKDLKQATAEFDHADASVDPEMREEWTKAEAAAMKKRMDDVKVMDIYDVQAEKGIPLPCSLMDIHPDVAFAAPGRAAYQLELAEVESTAGAVRGTVAWLASGLRIQESQ
jgi:hypothetical protein